MRLELFNFLAHYGVKVVNKYAKKIANLYGFQALILSLPFFVNFFVNDKSMF